MNVNIVKEGEYEFNNFVYITKNSLDENCCNEIIKLFENSDKTYKGVTSGGINENIKTSIDLRMDMDPKVFKDLDKILYDELNKHLYKYIDIANQNCHTIEVSLYEDSGFQIKKYIKNIGFYKYHNDEYINFSQDTYRVITYIWYLNNIEIGGETEFGGNIKIKPETGKLVLFPASWTFPHCGLMPVDNDKYIVSGWISCKLNTHKNIASV
jgi:hypothetical protein